MKSKLVLIASLLLVVSMSVSADDDFRLELKLRYWLTNFEAETEVVEEIFGGDIDLDDDFNVGDGDLPELQLRWQFKPKHALIARYIQLDNWGENLEVLGLLMDNRPIVAPNFLRSDLELKYLKLGWRRKLFGNEVVKVETIVDLAVFDIEAEFSARTWLISPLWKVDDEDEDELGFLPLLGLSCGVTPLKRLSVFAEVSGMYAGSYGSIIDAEAGLRFVPWGFLSIEGGYRYLEIDVELDNEDTQVQLDGPFVGASVRF